MELFLFLPIFIDSDGLDNNLDFEGVDKRLSEFLGGPGKRLSEFLGGPGKRTTLLFNPTADDETYNNGFLPEVRLKRQYGEPGGSEFLGGPGRKRKRSYFSSYPIKSVYLNPYAKRLSEFLGGPGKRSQYNIKGSSHQKRLSEFLGGPGKRLSEFLGGPGKRLSEFLGGPGRR